MSGLAFGVGRRPVTLLHRLGAMIITAVAAISMAAGAAAPGRAAGDAPPAVTLAAAGNEGGGLAFDQYCSACHGPDARGVANMGANLVDSAFVAGRSREELVEFLKLGRLADDPASVSGRPMPGFAWVNESELDALAAFLKSLRGGG